MTAAPPTPSPVVLALNAGSTSLKASLLQRGADGWERRRTLADLPSALAAADGAGVVLHRVVHGGARSRPVLLDDAVVDELRALTDLVPLHQPPALDAVQLARAALPRAHHVACFDTAFHTTLPAAASTYALPRRLRDLLRVRGFHGLSHAWASARARERFPDARRVLVAHLGGGASLCAVLDGRSVATTMGFTPLDGLVMATRSGAIDPGALLWLARTTDEDLSEVLERESGLLGLCGTSDLSQVLARAHAGDTDAALARDVYVQRLVTSIAATAAAMDGLDALVFTGGVGEHVPELRVRVTSRLAWLGVPVRAPVLVVPAREDLQMAVDAGALMAQLPG